jgi:nucleoside-diphosphate-sugar epimerase
MGRVFDREDGKPTWDYVFNCGGETRYSQEEEMYKLRILDASVVVATEAAKRGVKIFVQLSSGMVYAPSGSKPRHCTDKLKPWTKMARYELQAEEALREIPGLNLAVVRLAHVYGKYSWKYISNMLTMARTYQHLGQEMKWLWDKDLRVNTVHVEDVVEALGKIANWYTKEGKKGWDDNWGSAPTFNIVDHGNTCK